MPRWISLTFQDPASTAIKELTTLHDHILVIILLVLLFITYIFIYLLTVKQFYKNLSENTFIETVWSIIPTFLIVVLAVPSIRVLFIIEDMKSPALTFKVVAHQWYWTYVSPIFKNLSFKIEENIIRRFEYDSFIESTPRLLGCTSDLFIPVKTSSRILITSTDVIHSFAVPSLGLKVDAIPGRINQLYTNPTIVGLFFGQCSEICGSNHSFIPVSLKVCSLTDFDSISKNFLLEAIEAEIIL